ncbi:MAG: TraX family protein, partial [Anaerotignaceae bacterium]
MSDFMRNDFIKIIGLITMTIDHIGMVIFPHEILFRIIGRIAFPIFAFQLAQGVKYTSDIKRYITRLFIFAIVSQPIYMINNP